MNRERKAKKRKVEFDYAATFDRLMQEQFGEVFTTEWNLFAGLAGGYITLRSGGKPLTKLQAFYGRGLSNGMAEIRASHDH